MAFMIEKIMKLETSLTWDDFHGDSATIEVVNEGGVDRIASWKHKTVKQPSDSAINAITDKTILDEHNVKMLRMERNNKLTESDWTQNRDVTLSNDADWKTYRQALRDITKDYKSLEDVKWPEKPE
tara:strand:+ start:764 stop:1141 length:378 start_codon:yes stop_codon:yes gene_type:complete